MPKRVALESSAAWLREEEKEEADLIDPHRGCLDAAGQSAVWTRGAGTGGLESHGLRWTRVWARTGLQEIRATLIG